MGGDATDVSDVLIGLPSVVSKHTHTLILGSFLDKASLAVSQYYAHLKNQFCLLMVWLFELVHQEDSYGQRVSALLLCGVGIWDIYYRCRRAGSVDAGIRYTVLNDFSCLKWGLPALKQVLLNERTIRRQRSLLSNTDIVCVFCLLRVQLIQLRLSGSLKCGKRLFYLPHFICGIG